MPHIERIALPRRTILRCTAFAIPASLALTVSGRAAADDDCDDAQGCATELAETFSATSFDTGMYFGGTNYSILFATTIGSDGSIPAGATGYRITSVSVAGTTNEGASFSVKPTTGEMGWRKFDLASGSSLGFVVEHPWRAESVVRSFDYTYDVTFMKGFSDMQTCRYVTEMTLDDNGLGVGGLGSVKFSTPTLASCPA